MKLPAQIQVLERGWLSSNNILFHDPAGAALIDSGYQAHSAQTLQLVGYAIDGKPLARLINTHCHSDHIGGNAELARAFGCRISIPVGEAPAIAAWDDDALMLAYTGQTAERFSFHDTYSAGDTLQLGGLDWMAIAAPGHDMHALMLYSPEAKILISGDALWENGFGLIFPELFGQPGGFDATRATLESITRLDIETVIPGHGAPFHNPGKALESSFQRLEAYQRDPTKLARHALKAILSFALMMKGRIAEAALPDYLAGIAFYGDVNGRFLRLPQAELTEYLIKDLGRSSALTRRDGWLLAAG